MFMMSVSRPLLKNTPVYESLKRKTAFIRQRTLRNWTVIFLCALLLGCLLPVTQSASAADTFYIIGQVKDGNGDPFSDINVSASNISTGFTYHAATNTTGAFNISLPGGTYNISAIKVNYSSNVTYHEIVIGPNRVVSLDFTLNEILGRVFGFVTSGNASVDGVIITLSNTKQSFIFQSQLPFGQYSVDIVTPGVYVAKAEKTGYWIAYAADPVIVTRGSSIQLNFSLEVQPARVFGIVSVAGTLEKEVKVELLLGGIVIRQTQTDNNGNYSFANLQSGEYELRLSKDGLEEKIVQVSLAPFEDKRVDPIMARSPVEGLQGFIGDLDLAHSLMVVAMLVTVIIMTFAIFIRMRSIKKPDMLANEEEELEEKSRKK